MLCVLYSSTSVSVTEEEMYISPMMTTLFVSCTLLCRVVHAGDVARPQENAWRRQLAAEDITLTANSLRALNLTSVRLRCLKELSFSARKLSAVKRVDCEHYAPLKA